MLRNFLASLSAYFNPLVLAGATTFGLLLFGAFLLSMQLLRPQAQPRAAETAIIFVIPAATSTPLITPAAPTPTIPPEPQLVDSGEPIEIGAYVQVAGTGVDGLRVRVAAGLASEVRFVAIESEVFLVMDGPQEIDGYLWWYLQAPYDESVYGWAVAQYLRVIQRNP